MKNINFRRHILKHTLESLSTIILQRIIFSLFSVTLLLFITDNPFFKTPLFFSFITATLTFFLIVTIAAYEQKHQKKSLIQIIKSEWQISVTKQLSEKYHFNIILRLIFTVITALFIVCIIYVIFIELSLDCFPLKYDIELRNLVASCAGALIGCIPAFLALNHSRKELINQHVQSLESRRCSVMPVVDLTILPFIKYPSDEDLSKFFGIINGETGKYSTFFSNSFQKEVYDLNPKRFGLFYVRNIGLGPAIDVTITSNNITFYSGEVSTTLDVYLILDIAPSGHLTPKNYNFKICYKDVFSNLYETTYSLNWDSRGFCGSDTTPPTLAKRSDAFKI